jgi:hypothetical protein
MLPALISNLLYSFSGHAPKIYWYLSRSAGFVGLTILWLSMALGLSITNKMARLWPGAPTAFAIHEYVSLLGLAFVAYHGLVLIGDHFVDFSLPRLLVPFSIGWKIGNEIIGFSLPRLMDPFAPESKPFWIGLGQVGFYVWAIVALSFYVRRWIGQKTWRIIHYVNFGTYIMGWLHGTFTGTDSGFQWVRWYYWISGGSLLILLGYRIYDSALKKKNFSFPQFLQQRALSLSRVLSASKNRSILPKPKERNLPEALLREQTSSAASSVDKTVMPAITLSTPPQMMSDNSSQVSQEEKTQPGTSETATVEEQSHPMTDSPATSPAAHPEVKVSQSAFIEKYEMGSGKNRINVRIFKEPPIEPVTLEPQKVANTKHVDPRTLLLRLKKDFTATPTRPRPPLLSDGSKRVAVLED